MPTPPYPPLPADDWTLSPRTGWTRAHWEAVADRLLEALVPYATPGFAQYRLPGRTSWSGAHSDGLEGFARSFLLASFRIAGASGDPAQDPHAGAGSGGRAGQSPVDALVERYARGLTAGTDPDGDETWPEIAERSQPMVEAASIAIGLHETRRWIWDRLDGKVQQRVVDWFSGFIGNRTVDNNWRLFQVVSEQFLSSVGAPYRQSDIDGGLDRIEDWYLGDGWYTDGDGRSFDYYNGWAMHFYPLLWARIAHAGGRVTDRGRVAAYHDRLRQFLDGYQHFFGSDGAPVHQGRSLTYRFASAAPVWMGALTDSTPLAPGLTRRLASGALRHFVDRGAPDGQGLLRLGWYESFLPVTQAYSGPASPYWASKGFLGLLLPAGHPVWTEPELPLPIEESDRYTALPAPGWLLHGTRGDGIVRLLNHGSDDNRPDDPDAGDDPHYSKLAYSSRTAPQTAPAVWQRRVDGHIALLSADGTPSRRTVIHPLAVSERAASSWHAALLPGHERPYRITTTALPYGPCEVRVHHIEAPDGLVEGRAGWPGSGLTVRDGGHAVAGPGRPHAGSGDSWALARRDDGLTSAVVALYGWERAAVEHAADANAFGRESAVPHLTAPVRARQEPGPGLVFVSLVVLSGEPVDPPSLRAGFRVAVADDVVSVGFPDGSQLTVADGRLV